MPPATIYVPTQNNGTKQSLTLPAVPEYKETNEKDVFVMENEDPKVDQGSKENFHVANTPIATMSARGPNNHEVDATKDLLNNQLTKLWDAAGAAKKQEILYQFAMEAACCLGKSEKKTAPVPNSDPSKFDPDEHHFAPFLTNPIGTPIPNNIKGNAPSLGTDI